MLYKTDIANLALGRLGTSQTITDIELDNSLGARLVRRHFRSTLDDVLEQHAWNFARKTQLLTIQFNDPEPGYSYAYHMPVDSLIVRQIAMDGNYINDIEMYPDQMIPFKEVIIGTTRLLYTNLPNAHAEYTAQMPENSVFPTHFGKGLAAQLSLDIAPSLITSNFPKIEETLNSRAENAIAKGIADDLSRQPQARNAKSTFVSARY